MTSHVLGCLLPRQRGHRRIAWQISLTIMPCTSLRTHADPFRPAQAQRTKSRDRCLDAKPIHVASCRICFSPRITCRASSWAALSQGTTPGDWRRNCRQGACRPQGPKAICKTKHSPEWKLPENSNACCLRADSCTKRQHVSSCNYPQSSYSLSQCRACLAPI
jgi:hypothetical protein